MPQTLVSTASSVDTATAMFATLPDGDGDARPAARTASPPRKSRVVAFTSAKRAIARVKDALTAQDARPEVADA
jgi:hypothetical protein